MRQALIELTGVVLYIAVCIILLALVLVGCEKGQEVQPPTIIYQDTDDWFANCTIDSVDTNEHWIRYYYHHAPCPPCPDTVRQYKVKVVEYRMPPGRWVNTEALCTVRPYPLSLVKLWPDSIFILSDPAKLPAGEPAEIDTGYIKIPLYRSLDLIPTDEDSVRYEIRLKE